MLKQTKNQILWSTFAMLLPMLGGLCLWGLLPDKLPTHWNFAGEVDGWSSKAFAVFGIPGIVLLCHLLCVFGTAMDPKHKNMQGKMLTLVYWICPVTSITVSAASYAVALGAKLEIQVLILVLVGILFLVMGNWLPKCQPNYTVGIKLPWTVHSEDNWRKTHRMAGPVWIAGGILTVISAFLGIYGLFAFITALILMVAAPTVYSYMLYRKSV